MAAFAATYTYSADSADQRANRLQDHLAFIDKLESEGILQLVGKLQDAAVDILFVLSADSVEAARAALGGDPYNEVGAIASVRVYPWNAKRGALGPI